MNAKLQAFQEFLAAQSFQVPIWGVMLNLLIAAGLAYLLAKVYVRYGASLSNRVQFSRNFMLLAMTTTLVITIIKTSLALSLGLVGALSIVRFRAAIKEPEELAYLFLNIAIGLGLGAEQRLITIVSLGLIVGAIWFKSRNNGTYENQNLFLTLVSRGANKISLEQATDILKKNCSAVNLKRFDEMKDVLEVSFIVEFSDYDQLKKSKEKLRELDDALQITFLDNKGLV